MNKGQVCNELRKQYRGDGSQVDVLTAEQQQHLTECAECKKWSAEIVDMAQKSSLPQFDVPEKLTQDIMAAIAAESKRPALAQQGLMIPLGIACAAVCLTLVPLDNLEGYGATAVAAGILVLINFFIRSEKGEGAAASQ